MNDVLRIARLKIALQRAFLGRAILIFTRNSIERSWQVATCQQVEVHEVLLAEDASTFSSSINRGRLDIQVNTHLFLLCKTGTKTWKKANAKICQKASKI